LWRMAQGPDVSLMNTVKLFHLCEMGQRGTESDWFLQPGITHFGTQRSSGTLLVRFASKIIIISGGQTVSQ
jgi:hypothetical protein